MKPTIKELSLLVCLFPISIKAQQITYLYDDAGNRILREIVLQRFTYAQHVAPINNKEKVNDHVISINVDNTEQVMVSIDGNLDGYINIYNAQGLFITKSAIVAGTTTVNTRDYDNGVYILVIEAPNIHRTWKIIKK